MSGQRFKHVFEDFKSININVFSCATKRKCHPELTFSLAENINNIPPTSCTAKRHVKGDLVPQKESKTREVAGNVQFSASLNNPRHVSGSCPRNIIPAPENIKSIPFASRTAQRHVRGGCAPRKAAFTLAEVLITLGIIGVVAAMTLPTLIQNYQDKATVSRLKKVYSELSQAYMMVYKDNGEPTNWDMSLVEKDDDGNIIGAEGSKNMGDLFSKYLKVTKNCGLNEGCWYKGNVYSLNGKIYDSGSVEDRSDLYKIALADGTLIAFGGLSSDCSVIRGNSKQLSNVCSWVIVDINGANRPNTYGIDLFEFLVSKYGIVPYGTPDDIYFPFETACRRNSTGVTAGNGCTAWVLYKENLDYTRCNDLSWNGKHKCK